MEEPEIDRLYGLPLDEFTPGRDALAARLKTAGDSGEAARVKAMRKPTAPAWAVNQLARRYPKQVEVLIAASDRLRRSQQELLEGAPAGDLWEATLAEREAVAELIKAAEWILTEAGLGAGRGALDRVSDTLYAAAADPSGRTLLRRGRITQEMRRAGFGDLITPAPARSKTPAAKPARKGEKAKPARGPTAKQLLEAERDAERAVRDAARAEAEAERLDKAARRADEEAAQARKRAEAARRSAAEARREAGRAETRLEKVRQSKG
jgi:hypothetical protein